MNAVLPSLSNARHIAVAAEGPYHHGAKELGTYSVIHIHTD